MSKVVDPNLAEQSFCLPYHGVLKEDSLTTKLRVLFDGSCPSSTGVFINDLHLLGPTIQSDIFYYTHQLRAA